MNILLLFLSLCKTLAAVDRTVLTRLEGNSCFVATCMADSGEHLALGSASVLLCVTASLAAQRLINKALGCVEFLLASSENEFLVAVFADESLVFVHCFYLALDKDNKFCPRTVVSRAKDMNMHNGYQ